MPPKAPVRDVVTATALPRAASDLVGLRNANSSTMRWEPAVAGTPVFYITPGRSL
jgi:hypothetical protein